MKPTCKLVHQRGILGYLKKTWFIETPSPLLQSPSTLPKALVVGDTRTIQQRKSCPAAMMEELQDEPKVSVAQKWWKGNLKNPT